MRFVKLEKWPHGAVFVNPRSVQLIEVMGANTAITVGGRIIGIVGAVDHIADKLEEQ